MTENTINKREPMPKLPEPVAGSAHRKQAPMPKLPLGGTCIGTLAGSHAEAFTDRRFRLARESAPRPENQMTAGKNKEPVLRASKEAVALYKSGFIDALPIFSLPAQLQGVLPDHKDLMMADEISYAAAMHLMDSDLHKYMQEAFGKQDMMVPGKYKRARLFLFETPSLYLFATCETGDRGSSWYASRKTEDSMRERSSCMQVGKLEREWSAECHAEMSAAFRRIMLRTAEAAPEFATAVDARAPGFLSGLRAEERASSEKKRISKVVNRPPPSSSSNRKPRM